jgi:hypothetical protein
MTVTFYPKRLLFTAGGLLALWLLLSIALDRRLAGALAIAISIGAAVFLDLFFTVNPALWGRWRRPE